MGVYIDVNLGLVVKDLMLAEPLATIERTLSAEDEPGAMLAPIDPDEARARIEEAFDRLDELLEEDPELPVSDDVEDLRTFVEAHVRDLPEGGAAPARFPVTDAEFDARVAAAVTDFLTANEARSLLGRWGEDLVDHVARHLAEQAVATSGDPMRVSPNSVEISQLASFPGSGCFEPDDMEAITDITCGWAAWSLQRRGLERYLEDTVRMAVSAGEAAVGIAGFDLDGPPDAGDFVDLITAMVDDGIDLLDDAAVAEWAQG